MNNCRFWPPFYEKEINGQCIKVPPKVESSRYEFLGLIGVILVIAVPIFLMTKIKSTY